MEKEGSINCNCVDIVYDERSKSLKNGKYATVDNVDRGSNVFIPVADFNVKSNNLPDYVNKAMELKRKARPTTQAQNAVKEATQKPKVGDMDK